MRIPPRPTDDNVIYPSDRGIMSEDRAAFDSRFHEVTDEELRLFQRKQEGWTWSWLGGWVRPILEVKRSKPYMDDTPEPLGAPE